MLCKLLGGAVGVPRSEGICFTEAMAADLVGTQLSESCKTYATRNKDATRGSWPY